MSSSINMSVYMSGWGKSQTLCYSLLQNDAGSTSPVSERNPPATQSPRQSLLRVSQPTCLYLATTIPAELCSLPTRDLSRLGFSVFQLNPRCSFLNLDSAKGASWSLIYVVNMYNGDGGIWRRWPVFLKILQWSGLSKAGMLGHYGQHPAGRLGCLGIPLLKWQSMVVVTHTWNTN